MYVSDISTERNELILSNKSKDSYVSTEILDILEDVFQKHKIEDETDKFKQLFDEFAEKHQLSKQYVILPQVNIWNYKSLDKINRKIINYKKAYLLKPKTSDPLNITTYLLLDDKLPDEINIDDKMHIRNNLLKIREFLYLIISEVEYEMN